MDKKDMFRIGCFILCFGLIVLIYMAYVFLLKAIGP